MLILMTRTEKTLAIFSRTKRTTQFASVRLPLRTAAWRSKRMLTVSYDRFDTITMAKPCNPIPVKDGTSLGDAGTFPLTLIQRPFPGVFFPVSFVDSLQQPSPLA